MSFMSIKEIGQNVTVVIESYFMSNTCSLKYVGVYPSTVVQKLVAFFLILFTQLEFSEY